MAAGGTVADAEARGGHRQWAERASVYKTTYSLHDMTIANSFLAPPSRDAQARKGRACQHCWSTCK